MVLEHPQLGRVRIDLDKLNQLADKLEADAVAESYSGVRKTCT